MKNYQESTIPSTPGSSLRTSLRILNGKTALHGRDMPYKRHRGQQGPSNTAMLIADIQEEVARGIDIKFLPLNDEA